MKPAAPRGQSLVKFAVVGSVEYSRTLLRRRLDLTATLPHDPSAGLVAKRYRSLRGWLVVRRSVGLNARPARGSIEFRLTAVVLPQMQCPGRQQPRYSQLKRCYKTQYGTGQQHNCNEPGRCQQAAEWQQQKKESGKYGEYSCGQREKGVTGVLT